MKNFDLNAVLKVAGQTVWLVIDPDAADEMLRAVRERSSEASLATWREMLRILAVDKLSQGEGADGQPLVITLDDVTL